MSALERLVVQPPLGLLAGGSVEDAFADADEVLRFTWKDGTPALTSP